MPKLENTPQSQTSGFTSIGYLDAEKCRFYINRNGFLCLNYDGVEYNRVQALRSLPLTYPDVYICIHTMDNEEVGILKDLNLLTNDMRKMVQDCLERRYYFPVITQINSIKEKMGFYYFDVNIGDYKKTFSIKNIRRSIKELQNGDIMLNDVDGNRYLIKNLGEINSKVARQLEPYLD